VKSIVFSTDSKRRYGSFMRSFQVPEGVDTGKIEASFYKGVLTVKLPKTAEGHLTFFRIVHCFSA